MSNEDKNNEDNSDNSNNNNTKHEDIAVATTSASSMIMSEQINDQMSSSYLDYAYSVIIGRAIPDVRDGLKPVHRRIIYSMYQNKFTHSNPYHKCARIVGDVLGKYHPHGDSSVYDALVRMAQDFSLRYPIIEGQGNFGSIDGDTPAAMRYTEARLQRLADEIIADIEKDTVEFMPNFDESLQEPRYLPTKLPLILMNGTSGIAVGMRTNMPPYNLRELIQGIIAVIDKPEIYPEELTKYIKGPDFPTGGIIIGKNGIRHIINTGKGRIILRGRVEIIDDDKKKRQIIITEIPYQVNKSRLVEKIADLILRKRIHGVTDLRDESSRKGIRVVLDLNRNADPNAIIYQMYKNTNLQISYNVVNLVLINDGKQPHILNLKQLIKQFISFRNEIIIRRTEYDLRHAKERIHILDGLLIAINNIDEIIRIIKSATDTAEANNLLMSNFSLTQVQATEILNMPLKRLTNLQLQKLKDEKDRLEKDVIVFKEILDNYNRRMEIIKEELLEIEKKYGDERKTEIIESTEEFSGDRDIIRTIPEEDFVVMLTANQYIKNMTLDEYKSQQRGGKGKKGINIKEEDFITDVFVCSSHDKLLLFTEDGRVYSKYAYEIPISSRTSKGKALVNFVGLKNNEKIVHMLAISDFDPDAYLIFATKKGMVKKTKLIEFKNIRKTGIMAIKLRENDKLINVKLNEGDNYILIGTKKGLAIKFSDLNLRPLRRTGMGVRGIKLQENDEVVDMVVGDNEMNIITITKNGYAKKSKMELYRAQNRGGKGVINIKFHSDDDYVISIKSSIDEDLLIATTGGMVIRVPSKSLRTLGRPTKGVRVINLKEGDAVSSVALCEPEEEEEEKENEKDEKENEKNGKENAEKKSKK
ncbi:MAG: DNA gyrase subunit A [Promethearchaeota archaeon]